MHPRFEEALRRLKGSKLNGVDVETSGLDWKRNHIVGYVLSFGPAPTDTYYLPFRHAGGGNIDGSQLIPQTVDGWDKSQHPAEVELIKDLDRQGVHNFGHNIAFDMKFLWAAGMKKLDATFECTQNNMVLINEWQPSVSLDACTKVANVWAKKTEIYAYLTERFPEIRTAPKQAMGHFWRLAGDDPVAVEYAESDGVATWQLRDWQLPQIAAQELDRVYNTERDLLPVLCRMMTRGIRVDVDRVHAVKEIINVKNKEALQELPDGFNSRAPSQVRALMEKHGFTDWPRTLPTKNFPEGNPSFNEKWLITNPIGRQIVKTRKLSNLLASFIEPLLDDHLWNGRIYPEYHQLRGDEFGTITGRLSSSNPNLQQVNKRDPELGRLHRSVFIPDEGKIWGSADYSQMEPRILAYYSRCKVLLEDYRNNPKADAHKAVAVAMYSNWDNEDAASQKLLRENGKRVNQTLLTGGGKKVIVERYGVKADEVDKIWDDYFKAMPEIKSLQNRASRAMRDRGYIVSLLGRRSRLNDPNKSYVGVNRLLQLGNADCIKVKMVELDAYYKSEGDRVNLLSNCHDALESQFGPEDEKVYREGLNIMTKFGEGDVIAMDVPITVDAKEGKNWAEATWGPE